MSFVCSCAGYRRVSTSDRRIQREKKESRCGCDAMFCVHVHFCMGWWYVTCWNFEHSHLLLDLKLSSLLPAHRKMSATDIMQIENYRKVGITPPHIRNICQSLWWKWQSGVYLKKYLQSRLGMLKASICFLFCSFYGYLLHTWFSVPCSYFIHIYIYKHKHRNMNMYAYILYLRHSELIGC